MYETLTASAVLVGVVAMVIAGLAVWDMLARREPATHAVKRLGRWSLADYGALALFIAGFVFLLANSLLAIRDRDEFPFYHLGYLLCGFVFLAFAGLFAFIRLSVLVRQLGRERLSAGAQTAGPEEHQGEPDETDEPEQRVQ